MSVQERAMLLELARLMRAVAARVMLPPVITGRIEELERAAAVSIRAPETPVDPLGLVRRIEALEAQRDPPGLTACNAQRIAQGEALRASIAAIVQSYPAATGPRVIEALRASHADKLPSLRTVRWHLAALRNGNGNARVLPPPGAA